jgi:radical SAM superfamily enzyme YgiQ (UPF0313 family)
VIEEVTRRIEQFGVDYFSFRSGTFTADRERVIKICQRLTGLNVKWECLTRVDKLDERLLRIMKSAGCDTIRVGIESGSPEILKYMNKRITLDQVRRTAKILNDSGIFWSAYFMLGVPIETEETIEKTMSLIAELDPPFISLAKFTPLPGTRMYDDAMKGHHFDESTTDWTWAANHSMGEAFVRKMSSDRFLVLMDAAAQTIKTHNARHAEIRSDLRLK